MKHIIWPLFSVVVGVCAALSFPTIAFILALWPALAAGDEARLFIINGLFLNYDGQNLEVGVGFHLTAFMGAVLGLITWAIFFRPRKINK